ncbi:MAG: nucleoside hydrolase [Candidatus Bathyarchaeota archaeon]|nr:nucleoside hydrolase [Candidatus Bathyarchaeota archaeon]MDH5688478.1 nucleoside hydrolase [Candidatus Bathyarchaeota archaeon]
MKRIIVDTDIGIDDALALILALKSKELRLEAITTVSGNVHVDKCTKNALRILELMDRKDVPAAKGASRPLKRELHTAEHVHGKDGLGDSGLPEPKIKPIDKVAADMIIEKVARDPGEMTLVPIGPLTNIALAMEREPRLAEKVKEIVLMGGAYGVSRYGYGNATPVAEFNIYTDPEAARRVYESGAQVTAIGLDITNDPETLLTQEDLGEIERADSTAAQVVVKITENLFNYNERRMSRRAMAIHDAIAVSYLIYPNLFTVKKYRVDIETKGEFTTGQTVTDRRIGTLENDADISEANVHVCTSVRGRQLVNLLVNRIMK